MKLMLFSYNGRPCKLSEGSLLAMRPEVVTTFFFIYLSILFKVSYCYLENICLSIKLITLNNYTNYTLYRCPKRQANEICLEHDRRELLAQFLCAKLRESYVQSEFRIIPTDLLSHAMIWVRKDETRLRISKNIIKIIPATKIAYRYLKSKDFIFKIF